MVGLTPQWNQFFSPTQTAFDKAAAISPCSHKGVGFVKTTRHSNTHGSSFPSKFADLFPSVCGEVYGFTSTRIPIRAYFH
jgi:hypothetical protein